jgi:hypothetical protein
MTKTIALLPFLALFFLAYAQYAVRGLGAGSVAMIPLPPKYWGTTVDPRIINGFLGVRLMVADLLWIDAMIKSDLAKAQEPFSDFYQAFKAIVTLDPDHLYAYYVAGLYLSVIKDDYKGATAILRDGMKRLEKPYHWENAWQIPFMLGYNLIAEEFEFVEGSQWIIKAAEMPGTPEYIKKLALRVSTDYGRLEVAERNLAMAYQRFEKKEEKEAVYEKLLKVRAKKEALKRHE